MYFIHSFYTFQNNHYLCVTYFECKNSFDTIFMVYKKNLHKNIADIIDTIHKHPVEALILLMLSICDSFLDSVADGLVLRSAWFSLPILLLIAYIARTYIHNDSSWRRAYEMIFPLSLIILLAGIDEKFVGMQDTTAYNTIVSLLSIWALTIGHFKNDSDFIVNMTSLGWAAIRSFFVVFISWASFFIVISVAESILEVNIDSNILHIPWTLVFPILMFTLYEHTAPIDTIESDIANGILNFVVTIALMLFTLIMYIYIFKIIFSCELPSGGIARVTYIYFLTSIAASSLYRIAMVNIFNRFYYWLPLVAVPIIILFWIAVIRRIYDYGFTEQRVYMVAAGILNLVFMFMMVYKRQYTYKTTIQYAAVSLFVLGLVPPLSAENISKHLQWTNAMAPDVVNKAETESFSSTLEPYKIFYNNNSSVDITQYSKMIIPADVISHGDTIDILLTRDTANFVTPHHITLYSDKLIRDLAHQNNMIYDDFLGLAFRGATLAPLNLRKDSMLVIFRHIMVNSTNCEASVQAVLIE